MTNFEKYKIEINKIIDSGSELVAVNNGKPIACTDLKNCDDCAFVGARHCSMAFTKWLYEEYKEPKIQLPKDIKTDTPILVSHDGLNWSRRHFARFEFNGASVGAWNDGATSWTCNGQNDITVWQYAEMPE